MRVLRQRKKRRKNQGFTLLELMAGLVVISIVAGIFAWGSNSFTQTYRLRLAVRDIVGYLNHARSQATLTRHSIHVQVASSGQSYNNLKPVGNNAATRTARGSIFYQEGDASPVNQAFTYFNSQVSMVGLEKKSFEFDKAYRDIAITNVRLNGSKANKPIDIFFRPDGSVHQCSKVGTALSCLPARFTVCVRADPKLQQTGPNTVPRRIDVGYNGSIRVTTDNPSLCK